jgi:hypothetical protein
MNAGMDWGFIQEQQACISGCASKNLLVTKMNEMA